jgi:hypothetical protein
MNLADLITEAVEKDGLCELTVRVSQYAHLSRAIDEPAAWQAIAKYQGRVSGPWGVAIRDEAGLAIRAALEMGRKGGSSAVSVLTNDNDGGVFE